jgi:hypothetical protein
VAGVGQGGIEDFTAVVPVKVDDLVPDHPAQPPAEVARLAQLDPGREGLGERLLNDVLDLLGRDPAAGHPGQGASQLGVGQLGGVQRRGA